jgi:hypothetical protein
MDWFRKRGPESHIRARNWIILEPFSFDFKLAGCHHAAHQHLAMLSNQQTVLVGAMENGERALGCCDAAMAGEDTNGESLENSEAAPLIIR